MVVMSPSPASAHGRTPADLINQTVHWCGQHWLPVFTIILVLYIGLPWLAPVFMVLGWTGAGDFIYRVYSTQCHQLPQRSFFLFGDSPMLSLSAVQTLGVNSENPLVLRRFIGNADVGWKVAWSDRMVYMYTGLLLFGLVYWPLRRRLKPLPWWGLLLFLLPMAVDGFSHALSDMMGGMGSGFRFANIWLIPLTGGVFPDTFYTGDGFGSFNSWMRLTTGILFGLGVVWFAYPRLDEAFRETGSLEIGN